MSKSSQSHKLPAFGLFLCLLLGMTAIGAGAALPTIHYFDVSYVSSLSVAQQYDVYHTAACIQGLVNRQSPRLFVRYWSAHTTPYWGPCGGDSEWFDRLREPGGLCEGWPVRTAANLGELIDTFRPYINGLVLYEADAINGVRSTSLVATTVAGVERGIAVRKDTSPGSMYNFLVNTKKLSVLVDLTGKFTGSGMIWQTSTPSTGSAKCDAYIWAKEKYLDTGRCDSTLLFYTLDMWGIKALLSQPWALEYGIGTQLSNLDYAVSKKGFCFDLSPWGDEPATDDPTQPLGTDLNTFKAILNACNVRNNYNKMIKFCGFVPWDQKYSDHTNAGGSHPGVDPEWELARLISAYNAYKEADAADPRSISNASFYAGLVPAVAGRRYIQNPPPTYTDLQSRGIINASGQIVSGNYVLICLGDYDGASLTLYTLAGNRYLDPVRGQLYCNWGVDPNLTDRVSVAMDYMYRHKTEKDFFVGWDSGCGYVNPTELYGNRYYSGYPSIIPVWQEHCRKYYRMFDYSISAWLLPGFAPSVSSTDYTNYAPFSGDGIGAQQTIYSARDARLVNNIPCNTIGASNSARSM